MGKTREPDILIIGGGMAGIAAAREIENYNRLNKGKQKLTYYILEAQDRIGGRAKTIDLKGKPYDEGAAFFHDGENNELVHIIKTQFPNEFELTKGVYNLLAYPELGERTPQKQLRKKIDDIDYHLNSWADYINDKPIKDLIPEHHKDPLNKLLYETLIGAQETGVDLDKASLMEYYLESFGDDFLLKQGFGKFVERYGQGLSVEKNTIVNSINYEGDKIFVETNNGAFKANKVLVTVPIGVIQADKIKFTPEMPEELKEGFDSIQLGLLNKICLPFKKPLYNYITYPDDRVPSKNDHVLFSDNGENHMAIIGPMNNESITFLVGGKVASELERNGKRASVDYAKDAFIKLFGDESIGFFESQLDKENIVVTKWGKNEFSLCSYSAMKPGTLDIRLKLNEMNINDKVYFAGEHLAPPEWMQQVAGAEISGREKMQEIIRSLNIKRNLGTQNPINPTSIKPADIKHQPRDGQHRA